MSRQIDGGAADLKHGLGITASLLLCLAALTAAAFLTQLGFGITAPYAPYAVIVVVTFVVGAVPALAAARHLPNSAFGAANLVTLARGAMVALVFGLLFAQPVPALAWFATSVATAALILDGVDGRLARKHGTESAFGARLDMETDALATIVLAALVWHFDKAGAWVVLSGLMRYLFVAAGVVAPWLEAPLPPSRRRKTVCVVQIGSLLVCLAPIVPPSSSGPLAAAALVILGTSFAVDVAWLARARRRPVMPA